VLAAIRSTAVRLLEGVKASSKAAAVRRFAAHPDEALRLITAQVETGNDPGRLTACWLPGDIFCQ
jgi:hypothetical protein